MFAWEERASIFCAKVVLGIRCIENALIFLLVRFLTVSSSLVVWHKETKLPKNFFYNPELKEKYNPDVDTINWDLHKNRLKKFGRSQYKGLTFFIDDQGRIFYLTEDRKRVYC